MPSGDDVARHGWCNFVAEVLAMQVSENEAACGFCGSARGETCVRFYQWVSVNGQGWASVVRLLIEDELLFKLW